MKHHLIINEEQRDMIAAALAAYKNPCFEPSDDEELDLLRGMFDDLPTTPSEEEIVHDFTA